MRKPGWTYIKENMVTERPVAYFVNQKGHTAFYVIGIRNGYLTTDTINGIKSHFISYSDARKLNSDAEENQPDASDVLFSALVHACEKFEENYNEQVKNLFEQL